MRNANARRGRSRTGGAGVARALVLVGLLALASAAPVDAQGFAGGVNLASFFGGDVNDTDGKSGLALGLSTPIVRVGRVQLRAEGYYHQKGARDVTEFQGLLAAGERAEFGIDYVELPVLLRVELPGLGQRVFPYVQGGPALAWNLECGVAVASESGSPETACDDLSGENLERTVRDFETGLVVGGGFQMPVFGVGAITLDGRYTHGLSRLAEDSDIHNRAVSLMLGYSFALPYGATPRAGGGPPGLPGGS